MRSFSIRDGGGVAVDNYFASEIKETAIKVTQYNFPNTIQIGDVNNITYKNGILSNGVNSWKINFDLVCYGSPCQSFSIAMIPKHRIGLEDKKKSGLFYECNRIQNEVNPRYFFVENVSSMSKENKRILTEILGVEPLRINSKDYSPSMRDRLYWTNINFTKNKNDIKFIDILDDGWYTNQDKAHAILASGGANTYADVIKRYRRAVTKSFDNIVYKNKEAYDIIKKYYNLYFNNKDINDFKKIESKHKDFVDFVKNNTRILTNEEEEKCMTLPVGYTKCLDSYKDRRNCIGDGWTVSVITNFFKNIKE